MPSQNRWYYGTSVDEALLIAEYGSVWTMRDRQNHLGGKLLAAIFGGDQKRYEEDPDPTCPMEKDPLYKRVTLAPNVTEAACELLVEFSKQAIVLGIDVDQIAGRTQLTEDGLRVDGSIPLDWLVEVYLSKGGQKRRQELENAFKRWNPSYHLLSVRSVW